MTREEDRVYGVPTTTQGRDTTLDSQTDSPVLRPFADVFREIGGGTLADDTALTLADLVRAVQATGKRGNLTIKIDVGPMKNVADALVVNARVTSKAPEADPVATVYYSDDNGNLLRDHPRQASLFSRPTPVAQPDAHLGEAR